MPESSTLIIHRMRLPKIKKGHSFSFYGSIRSLGMCCVTDGGGRCRSWTRNGDAPQSLSLRQPPSVSNFVAELSEGRMFPDTLFLYTVIGYFGCLSGMFLLQMLSLRRTVIFFPVPAIYYTRPFAATEGGAKSVQCGAL